MKCTICNERTTKYKCPKCLIRYCSLPCYKNHKESCETPVNQTHGTEATQRSYDRVQEESSNEDEDRVGLAALGKLGESEELLRMLGNPHLRAMVRHLDSSHQTEKDLEAAMKEPIFTEFVDQCLHIVEPSTPNT